MCATTKGIQWTMDSKGHLRDRMRCELCIQIHVAVSVQNAANMLLPGVHILNITPVLSVPNVTEISI